MCNVWGGDRKIQTFTRLAYLRERRGGRLKIESTIRSLSRSRFCKVAPLANYERVPFKTSTNLSMSSSLLKKSVATRIPCGFSVTLTP